MPPSAAPPLKLVHAEPADRLAPAEAPRAPWSRAKRIAFRFTCSYLVLFYFPFPFAALPFTEKMVERYVALWDAVLPWIAARIFRIDAPLSLEQTGSGDRTADYIQLVCCLVLAVAATVVWSFVDRRRQRYDRLLDFLRIYVRYTLATTIIMYGFFKVFKSQFPFLTPDRLLQTYGQSSPMRLLWHFMGYSTPYTVFTGLIEVLGGALLYLRRTTALGALVLVGVMANVVMLNFSYDVPVKLYSVHLFATAVFLLLPDLRRLARFFVLNRPTEAADLGALSPSRLVRGALLVAKLMFIGAATYASLAGALEAYRMRGPIAPRHALYGAYEVEEHARDGQPLAPLITDTSRWRRVAVNNFTWMVFAMDDTRRSFQMRHDEAAGTLTLTEMAGEQQLAVTRPAPDALQLEGTFDGARISVRLRKVDESTFLLVNRGFRWINEEAYNR